MEGEVGRLAACAAVGGGRWAAGAAPPSYPSPSPISLPFCPPEWTFWKGDRRELSGS